MSTPPIFDHSFSDAPLRDPADDLLGRGPFTGRLAAIIENLVKDPSSSVVGLRGPWGSGKTTQLEFLMSETRI